MYRGILQDRGEGGIGLHCRQIFVTLVLGLAQINHAALQVACFRERLCKQEIESSTVADGASGLTGSTSAKDDKSKKDEPKKEEPKKGFGLGSLKKGTAADNQTAQVSASGGARGVGPDRAAKGGSNPAIVKVSVSAAELAAFDKAIA